MNSISPHSNTMPRDTGERRTTGLAGLDAVLGDLAPGALVCIAGRPCMGKTALLLDAAIRIHRQYRTNVVFATARDFPSEIIARAPLEARSALIEIPPLDILHMRNRFPTDGEPAIFLVDVHSVGATWPHVIADHLQTHHPAKCGLMVTSGWSVYPDQVSRTEVTIADRHYRAELERPSRLLSSALFEECCHNSTRSRVPALFGITTAENGEQWSGPEFTDLLHLSATVLASAARTVLIHRPEVYTASGPESDAKRGLIDLINIHANGKSGYRSQLRYDKRGQCFHSEP